jgi:DNA ligase (NAD+)
MNPMEEIIDKLNAATEAYDNGNPIMSDIEWDNLYFKLQKLEKESNYIYPNSPTHRVIFKVVDKLNKITHNHKMLSLDKTKDLNEVLSFVKSKKVLAMCKMDGLTCSIRYLNGKLVSAETRGNGLIGEDILHNALIISSIPNQINYTKELIIDGEIICKKDDFVEFESDYKNPRNFAAGSIRLLDSKECYTRHLTFVAWDVIKGFDEYDFLSDKLNSILNLGFTVVPYFDDWTESSICNDIKNIAKEKYYPIDGIVFKYDDISYGASLGETEHHFKNAIAYKFYDEEYDSSIKNIEWTMGRTGVLTPVAVFEPIEIDGSIVERASLHNISIMTELMGSSYVGQDIKVFKANMIIPQISWARGEVVGENPELINIPKVCPVCGQETQIVESDSGTQVLYCSNPACAGKLINRLDHFCGKKGLDIKGLSKATFEKLLDWGWITCLSDIFELKNHKNEWINKPGFGEKSVDNILNAIEASKNTTDDKFIAAIGIPLIGATIAKELCKKEVGYFHIREDIAGKYDFTKWDGIGWEISQSLLNFNFEEADYIWNNYLKDTISNPLWEDPSRSQILPLNGLNIVITGNLSIYKNRAALQADIEKYGGKVVGTVSKNTSYLINNDVNSTSSKNVTAKKLNIPIITEQDFIKNFLTL